MFLLLAVAGCKNPYVSGYTGDRALALPEGTPVQVLGANRADPIAMQAFDDQLAQARATRQMLGSSTIVSASPLRDEVAAQAGRQLGATGVYYSFAYLDSTVERQTDEYYRRSAASEYDRFERRTYDTTKHWYEYRAYFFSDGPPAEAGE